MLKLYCLPTIHGAIEIGKEQSLEGIQGLEAASRMNWEDTIVSLPLPCMGERAMRIWRHIKGSLLQRSFKR